MPLDDFTAPPVANRRVIIHYCNLYRWMLRATWPAQELLTTLRLIARASPVRLFSMGVRCSIIAGLLVHRSFSSS